MRRISLAALALALMFSLTTLPGCGSDTSVTDIQESDAAKNANKNAMDAMRGAVKDKSTGPDSKAAAKASAGVAPK